MEPVKMAKRVVEFNKTTFDSSFNAMVMMQEQSEVMFKNLIDQVPWIPEQGKKAVLDMGAAYKKGREEFKKAVDEGFKNVESYFSQADKMNNP
jgi:hypothetical protein